MDKNDLGTEKAQQIIDIWSKVVETQMHFNEMQVKSRQLGLTFVTAALGVGVVLLSKGNDFAFKLPIADYEITLHVSVFLVIGAIGALRAVRTLDLNVYHRMLRGAVTFGEDFEKNCLVPLTGLRKGMTTSISHFSRFNDASAQVDDDGRYKYCGKKNETAHDKILSFYKWTQNALIFSAVCLFLVTNYSHLLNSSDTKVLDTGEGVQMQTISSKLPEEGGEESNANVFPQSEGATAEAAEGSE